METGYQARGNDRFQTMLPYLPIGPPEEMRVEKSREPFPFQRHLTGKLFSPVSAYKASPHIVPVAKIASQIVISDNGPSVERTRREG